MPSITDRYRVVSSGAGWADRSGRGRLRFEGPDALPFLQALLTNEVASLSRGEGRYCAYLTPAGRMIADIEVLHRGNWVLASVARGMARPLVDRFEGLIFAEDLSVTDASAQLYESAVLGEGVVDALARALDVSEQALSVLPESHQVDWADGFIARAGGAPWPVFTLFGPVGGRQALIDRLEGHGVQAVDDDVIEALRVASGRPAWGAELTEQVIPLEAGLLDRAISTTKGCYVGQEIVIRMLHRGGGRVAKRLVTLEMGGELGGLPRRSAEGAKPGAVLTDEAGTAIGTLTSVAPSLTSESMVALGYLRGEHAEVGARVAVQGTDVTATVTGFGG